MGRVNVRYEKSALMLAAGSICHGKTKQLYYTYTMKTYYITVPGGTPQGPFGEDVIKQGVANGTYPADALVFAEGMTEWEPLSKHIAVATPQVPGSPAMPPFPSSAQAQVPAGGTTEYTFGQAITSCFKRYTKFDGRASRSEYWWFCLFYFIACNIPVIGLLVMLGLLVPSFAVAWRRMHDVNKAGWYALIPIYSLILAIKESEGPNQYGSAPAAPEK